MNGFLNIDKPAGMTSHDVVARVRRALRTRRAGHAGTLDPDAVGVLVVAVGQATRLLPDLPIEPKEYVARIAFGAATSTEDASGRVTQEADASELTETTVRTALPRFLGTIPQVPPMVSALHHQGRRLYELAREGVEVIREARTVTIHRLDFSDFTPGVRAFGTLSVVCGGGTYIRTLCKDLGEAVGLPAHMAALTREAVGGFRRENAVPLVDLRPEALIPAETALGMPVVRIDDAQFGRVRHGMAIDLDPATVPPESPDGGLAVALLHGERLCALGRYDKGRCQPFKVFPPEEGV
ncbi:MAG: tRNA pseudouridine(55) synthase TruB [Capsulimonadales bacterium]|nr:tRNA pseudouridine(55) synthase TruB [Capsulimonadales bacterium]